MSKVIITKEFLNKYFETDKFEKDTTLSDLGFEDVDLSDEVGQTLAIQKNLDIMKLIYNPSISLQLAFTHKYHGMNIYNYVKNPCEEAILNTIINYPYFIIYIDNPSEKLQEIAVNKDGDLIQHIKNPSEEIQKLAVQNSPRAIKYIDDPSEELQELAVRKSPHCVQYIKNPTKKVQEYVVSISYSHINYIEKPTENVQKLAIDNNSNSILYIKNPSKDILLYYLLKWGFNSKIIGKNAFIELIDDYKFDCIKLVEKPKIEPEIKDEMTKSEKIDTICKLLQSLANE